MKRAGDTGSVTPLILGFFVMVMLLGYAVAAMGGVFLARQQLQSRCDGAAAAAGDHIVPGWTGEQNADAARAAAVGYLAAHGGAVSVQVVVTDGRAVLACSDRAQLPLAGFFRPQGVAIDVRAASSPVFRG